MAREVQAVPVAAEETCRPRRSVGHLDVERAIGAADAPDLPQEADEIRYMPQAGANEDQVKGAVAEACAVEIDGVRHADVGSDQPLEARLVGHVEATDHGAG